MTSHSNDGGGARPRSVWAVLGVYLLVAWPSVEILFVVCDRLGLPKAIEPIVLGLFAAGFLAAALFSWIGSRSNASPVVRSLQLVGVTIVCAVFAIGMTSLLHVEETENKVGIAVMPCDYDGDDAHRYLGVGLAEEVHTRMSLLGELHVPAWRSVLQTHAVDASPVFVAQKLRVENIATCSVYRAGDVLTVDAQVTRPPNTQPFFQRRYDLSDSNLASNVADFADSLAEEIAPRIDSATALLKLPTANSEAYELLLRARAIMNPSFYGDEPMPWSSALEEAERLVQRAVTLDPEFAEAYAFIALQQWIFAVAGPDSSGNTEKNYLELATHNVLAALAADDCAAVAWVVASDLQGDPDLLEIVEWRTLVDEFDREAMVRKAISCQPNSARAWLGLLAYYTTYQARRPETAEELFEIITTERKAIGRAVALDPVDCDTVSAYAGHVLLEAYPFSRRNVEDQQAFEANPTEWRVQRAAENQEARRKALDAVRGMLVIAPSCAYSMWHLAYYHVQPASRRFDRALAWTRRAAEVDPEWGGPIEFAARLYLEMGLLHQAEEWGQRADQLSYRGSETLAYLSLLNGDAAPFLARIQQSVDARAISQSPSVIKLVYGNAARESARAREYELAVTYLEQGMAKLGIADPVAFLFGPRGGFRRRVNALYWALAYQQTGHDSRATALLDESRWQDPVIAEVTDIYKSKIAHDGYREALSGNPAEALRLIRAAVEGWEGVSRWFLLEDPILDSVRQHPEYGTQLLALIEEFDNIVAPMRENVLQAEASDDWQPLLAY